MFYHVKSVDRIILVVHLYSVESLVVFDFVDFDFVDFAHARHSSNKLGSALA